MIEETLEGTKNENIANNIPDAWQVADDFDVELLEELGVPDTRALQDLHRARQIMTEVDQKTLLPGVYRGYQS